MMAKDVLYRVSYYRTVMTDEGGVYDRKEQDYRYVPSLAVARRRGLSWEKQAAVRIGAGLTVRWEADVTPALKDMAAVPNWREVRR